MENKKKKKSKWMKFRHKVVIRLLKLILTPIVKFKYGMTIEKCEYIKKNQVLVISNHQTSFDQFFMSLVAYPRHLYYIASEDLFSKGLVSKLIKYLVAPIPFKKSTSDLSAVMNCMRVVREGGSIGLFPEGNRTYDGKLTYVKPSIANLVKALRIPVAIMKIEGGYGVEPRWAGKTRKGKMRAYVSKIIEPSEYKDMSNEELYNIISNELNVDEAKVTGEFKSKKGAEFLERVIYVCPKCGLSEFHSHKDTITCKNCNLMVRHLPTKELVGLSDSIPFKFVSDWYEYQNSFINDMSLDLYKDTPIYTDEIQFKEVIACKKHIVISKKACASLFGDRIVVAYKDKEEIIPFDKTHAMTVLGKNKLNIYIQDKIFQFKADKRFNALKYMNIFYRFKDIKREDNNGRFLGL